MLPQPPCVLADEGLRIAENDGLALVRPDGYIGLRAHLDNEAAVATYRTRERSAQSREPPPAWTSR